MCLFFFKQCCAVFCLREGPVLIRRCFKFPRARCDILIYVRLIYRQNDEKKHLLRSGTTTINYQTILTIPYAHVIRDDKIQIESSNVVDANTTDTYLLFNGTLPDQAYETSMYQTNTHIYRYLRILFFFKKNK